MALSLKTKNEISQLLIEAVKNKLKEYKPETAYAPFHHRLLGKDRYAMFSFIQSMNTTFGMSIWEQVAVILAKRANYKADRQYKLLRWTALRLSQDNNVAVFTRLAIAYNPYYPEPYERWTLKGLYDLARGEILVGEEFWNFVAGDDIYKDLLDVFQEAGKKLRPEIDKRFVKFRKV